MRTYYVFAEFQADEEEAEAIADEMAEKLPAFSLLSLEAESE